MLFHGIDKLQNGIVGIESLLTNKGLPTWIAFGVFIGEIVAPLLVLAGVLVAPAALVMVFNMVVAVALAHPQQLLALGGSGGYALELQAFYLFGSLAIALLAGRKG